MSTTTAPCQQQWCVGRLPLEAELEQAGADAEQRAWVYNVPTQAHVRASDAAMATALSAADAAAFEELPPHLAKLKADMLRVQATLPPAALAEAWQADAWQEVRVTNVRISLSFFPRTSG